MDRIKAMRKTILDLSKDLDFLEEMVNRGLVKDSYLLTLEKDLKEELVEFKDLDIKFKNNPRIIEIALQKDLRNVKYIQSKLLLEKLRINEITVLLNRYPLYLEYLPLVFRKDQDYCKRAVLKDFRAIKFVLNKEVLEDKNLFLNILDKDGMLLEYASDALKNDFEIVITAVTQNKESKKFISKEINDKIISLFS